MSFNQPTNKKDFEYMNRTTPIEDWEKEAYDFAMSLRAEVKEKEAASAKEQKKVKIYDPDFKLTKEEEQASIFQRISQRI